MQKPKGETVGVELFFPEGSNVSLGRQTEIEVRRKRKQEKGGHNKKHRKRVQEAKMGTGKPRKTLKMPVPLGRKRNWQ